MQEIYDFLLDTAVDLIQKFHEHNLETTGIYDLYHMLQETIHEDDLELAFGVWLRLVIYAIENLARRVEDETKATN